MKKTDIKKEYPYEAFIQESVLCWLKDNHYSKIILYKEPWEQGVDIKVKNFKYSRYWLAEAKGGSSAKNKSQVETNNFVFGLGQIVTRIQSATDPRAAVGSNKYGVAYPYSFMRFLRRKRLHWNLCKAINLYVFLVRESGAVEVYDWRRIKKEFY